MNEGTDHPIRPERVVDVLTQEIESLRTSVNDLLFSPTERIFGITAAVVIGGLTLAFSEQHRVVLLVLPIAVAVLYGYLIQMNTEMLSRAGHKRFVEEEANKQLGANVFLEELHVAVTRQGKSVIGRLSVALLQIATGGVLGVLIGFGFNEALNHRWWVTATYGGFVALSVTALGTGMRDLFRAYRTGYEAARDGWQAHAAVNIAQEDATGSAAQQPS